jgi:hypothetical protein
MHISTSVTSRTVFILVSHQDQYAFFHRVPCHIKHREHKERDIALASAKFRKESKNAAMKIYFTLYLDVRLATSNFQELILLS